MRSKIFILKRRKFKLLFKFFFGGRYKKNHFFLFLGENMKNLRREKKNVTRFSVLKGAGVLISFLFLELAAVFLNPLSSFWFSWILWESDCSLKTRWEVQEEKITNKRKENERIREQHDTWSKSEAFLIHCSHQFIVPTHWKKLLISQFYDVKYAMLYDKKCIFIDAWCHLSIKKRHASYNGKRASRKKKRRKQNVRKKK